MIKRNNNHKHYSHSRFARIRGKQAFHITIKSKDFENDENRLQSENINERDIKRIGKIKRLRNKRKSEIAHKQEIIKQKSAELFGATNALSDAKESVKDAKAQIKQIKQENKQKKKEIKQAKKNVKSLKKEVKTASKKLDGLFTSILVSILFIFAVLLLASVRWLFRTWPRLTMDEFLFQITTLEGTGTGMIKQYVLECAVPAILAGIGITCLIVAAHYLEKKIRRVFKSVVLVVSAICIGISVNHFWNNLSVEEYIENKTVESEFIETEYVNPSDVNITFPETKRNLIYIFLESMEITYSDVDNGGALEQNIIPNLTEISHTYENFSGNNTTLNGAYSLPGTTWTMGGLFAATAGIPLQLDTSHNSMSGSSDFFPSLVTIGDILEENGYTNVFACGSNGAFGGRENYFQTHGNYSMHDYFWAAAEGYIPEGYYVWWGFEDARLIEQAKDTLTELGNSNQPFNYTMLTVDTHFEDGYVDWDTEDVFGDQYANVIFHSDEQIAEFVSWIQEQPWYENTTIVISGDHPTMDKDFLNDVSTDYDKRVYTTYINSVVETEIQEERIYTTFDNFPTTLSALGVEIEGERLGLGTNLFSNVSTVSERYGINEEKIQLSQKSTFLSNLLTGNLSNEDSSYVEEIGLRQSRVRLIDYNEETQKVKLQVDDLTTISQEIDHLTATVLDSDGNEHVGNSKYLGNGSYQISIDIGNDINNVTLTVDAYLASASDEELEVKTLFNYSGNLCLVSESQVDFSGYIKGISFLDQSRYAIFLNTQANARAFLSDEAIESLADLGISNRIWKENSDVLYAVFTNGGTNIREGVGYIRTVDELPNGTPYVISSSDNAYDTSSILIGDNYEEYSLSGNGFNIVIWDMVENSVYHQYNYDTSSGAFIMNISATFDESTEVLGFDLYDVNGFVVDGDPYIRVNLYKDSDDTYHKISTMERLSDSWHSDFKISAEDLDEFYAIVYYMDGSNGWRRVAEGSVKNILVVEQKATRNATEDISADLIDRYEK